MGDLTIWWRIKRFFIEWFAKLLPHSVKAEATWLFFEKKAAWLGKEDCYYMTLSDAWNARRPAAPDSDAEGE